MIKIFLLPLLSVFLLINKSFGQNTPISATIVLTQKAEGLNSSASVFSLTLQNNTDEDLYIPDYRHILLGDSAGILFFVEKDGQPAPPMTEQNEQLAIWAKERWQTGALENPISGMPSFYGDSASQVNWFIIRDSITAQYVKNEKEPALSKVGLQLSYFFFLKAHEKLHYALKAAETAKELFKNRGSYTILYRPMLCKEGEERYPQQILTYKRFIPGHISCQPLYLEVK